MAQSFQPPAPGDIELLVLAISNFDGSETQDLRALCREFNIYESIFSDHIRADFVIEDALGLTTRMPIIGEEIISIKFRTPSVAPNSFTYDYYEFNFTVTKLQGFRPTNIRDGIYKIEGVSPYQITDLSQKINWAFGPGKISDMAKQIAKDIIGITAEGVDRDRFIVEETEGEALFVIPLLSPFETMHFLCSEAQSITYPPSNYIFFENRKGHQFVTLDFLMADPLRSRLKEQYFFYDQSRSLNRVPPQTANTSNLSFELLFTNRKNPSDFRAMASIVFNNTFDIEMNIADGLYDNMTLMVDPTMQKFEVANTFNYVKEFNKFAHTSKSKDGGEHVSNRSSAFRICTSNGSLSKLSGSSHMRYLVTNKHQTQNMKVYPRRRQDFLSHMISSRAQLQHITCQFTVPGDSDRVAGDMVYFDFHEIGATDDIIGELNKYLSGAYLVTTMRHKYTFGAKMPFTTIMECVKNCLEKEISNDKSGIERPDNGEDILTEPIL